MTDKYLMLSKQEDNNMDIFACDDEQRAALALTLNCDGRFFTILSYLSYYYFRSSSYCLTTSGVRCYSVTPRGNRRGIFCGRECFDMKSKLYLQLDN